MSGHQPKILVFIPMYNCAKQIGRVLAQFDEVTQAYFSELIVVDNRSLDDSVHVARTALKRLTEVKARLLINNRNYGLGGSHKVAFDYAIRHGFDYCVVLHGDDQGSIHDLIPYLRNRQAFNHDCLLGARFMPGAKLQGYSRFRTIGNYGYNLLYSLACMRRLYDLGAGLNIYKTSFLQQLGYINFADNLTFNYYAILATVAKGANFEFFPLTWREDDQVSNVKLFKQSLQGLKLLWQFYVNKQKFLMTNFANPELQHCYTSTELIG